MHHDSKRNGGCIKEGQLKCKRACPRATSNFSPTRLKYDTGDSYVKTKGATVTLDLFLHARLSAGWPPSGPINEEHFIGRWRRRWLAGIKIRGWDPTTARKSTQRVIRDVRRCVVLYFSSIQKYPRRSTKHNFENKVFYWERNSY